jgi:hemoglobin
MRNFNGWKLALLLASVVAMGLAEPSRAADDKPTAGDQRVVDALKDVINRGVDIFNPRDRGGLGDHNGCYRLFQGALMMARTQLNDHPNLQKEIDGGLANAERLPTPGERAHALRRVIDQVRETLNPNLKKAAEVKPADKKPDDKKPLDTKPADKKPDDKKPLDTKPADKKIDDKGPLDTKPADKKPAATATLWERLGGEKKVRQVVDDFVATVAIDPKVDFSRGSKYKLDAKGVEHLKQTLVEFIGEASGGPLRYSGRDMKTVHKGMGITDAEFDATAAHLKMALVKNGAAADDIAAVMKAVEGTRKDIVEPKKPEEKKDGADAKDKKDK